MDDLGPLFATHGRVEELEFDDDFLAHMVERGTYEKHTVALAEIAEVHEGAPEYFANLGTGRRALIIMVGQTQAGRWLCVPLAPAGREGLWRPVTAFTANTHHIQTYGRRQP